MASGDQSIDRQLGEFAGEMRAMRSEVERNANTTESIRLTLGLIQVQLGKMDGERRAAIWIRHGATALIASIVGALAGHINIPPGAH